MSGAKVGPAERAGGFLIVVAEPLIARVIYHDQENRMLERILTGAAGLAGPVAQHEKRLSLTSGTRCRASLLLLIA
jgi:hypothetical protein